jgi:hypothetical protein
MRRSSSFFAPAAALLVVGGVSLIDVRASHAADEALAVRSKRVAAAASVHHGRRWQRTDVVGGRVVTGGRLVTELSSRNWYIDPQFGYYGGPDYYGGPYYYRPYFDGASPVYFATHPIVEW